MQRWYRQLGEMIPMATGLLEKFGLEPMEVVQKVFQLFKVYEQLGFLNESFWGQLCIVISPPPSTRSQVIRSRSN